VAVTGGLAADIGLVAILRDLLAKDLGKGKKPLPPLDIRSHPLSPVAGAIGAAILGAFRFDQLQRRGQAQPTLTV
jgi:benzoyl-CoA reductase subunit D